MNIYLNPTIIDIFGKMEPKKLDRIDISIQKTCIGYIEINNSKEASTNIIKLFPKDNDREIYNLRWSRDNTEQTMGIWLTLTINITDVLIKDGYKKLTNRQFNISYQ